MKLNKLYDLYKLIYNLIHFDSKSRVLFMASNQIYGEYLLSVNKLKFESSIKVYIKK